MITAKEAYEISLQRIDNKNYDPILDHISLEIKKSANLGGTSTAISINSPKEIDVIKTILIKNGYDVNKNGLNLIISWR